MSVIGEATVTVKIDTSSARVDLDDRQRDDRRERDKEERDKDKKEKKEKRSGRFKRVPLTLASTRGAVRALPLAGLIYAFAQYGPAAFDFVLAFGDELSGGKMPAILRVPLEAVRDVAESAGKKADIALSAVEAAFGSVDDTTKIAKAAFLFRSEIDGEDMLDIIEGMYRIRYAQGLGRRTETKLGRGLIGAGMGTGLGSETLKALKMFE